MKPVRTRDLDYLIPRVHGRRSRLADGARLESLCRLSAIPDLSRALFADDSSQTVHQVQDRLSSTLALELDDFLTYLNGAEWKMAQWMALRFELANLKVRMRTLSGHLPPESSNALLMRIPGGLDWHSGHLATARSMDDLMTALADSALGHMLSKALTCWPLPIPLFLMESALDHEYFKEGIILANTLPSLDRNLIKAMVAQEADIFHVTLVLRGHFHNGLSRDQLSPLHLTGTHLPFKRFLAMLNAPDAIEAARLAAFHIWDSRDIFTLHDVEGLLWVRYLKLATRTFRQSQNAFGRLMGYIGLRWIEHANLTTLSEGIRLDTPEEARRTRIIRTNHTEASHV